MARRFLPGHRCADLSRRHAFSGCEAAVKFLTRRAAQHLRGAFRDPRSGDAFRLRADPRPTPFSFSFLLRVLVGYRDSYTLTEATSANKVVVDCNADSAARKRFARIFDSCKPALHLV